MATLQPFITVKGKRKPPSRLEGGGFMIKDIMAGVSFQELDPFLIWHELPEKHHRKGEMPGAPMHCHRGFIEAPYCKKFIGENGPNPDVDVMFVSYSPKHSTHSLSFKPRGWVPPEFLQLTSGILCSLAIARRVYAGDASDRQI